MRLLLMAIGLALVGLTLADEKYTDRYDNLNVQEILDNKRLFTSYVKCILDQGRCTAEGKELKRNIVDAMQHSCEKCTPWQRSNARKIVKHLREKETASWEQLKKKYDPDSTYQPLYEAFLAADD